MSRLSPISLFIGFTFALSLVQSQFVPVITHDPVAIVKSLKDRLEFGKQHIEELSHLSNLDNDFFVKHGKQMLATLATQQDTLNVSACARSIYQFIFQDLPEGKPYVKKMIDSWGKIESGILKGNLKWMGRYYECLDVHTQNFSGKWCSMAFGSSDSALFGIGATTSVQIATCLPDTCSEADVKDIISPITSLTKLPTSAYCPEQPSEYRAIDIIALLITSLLGILLIIGTSYDYYLNIRPNRNYDQLLFDTQEIANIENSNPTILARLVLAFSIIKNTKTLLDTSQKEGNINVLHGIRFISMTWVMLGHTFIFGLAYVDNPVDYANYYVTKGSFQAVGNAFFSVDTFFFLSGLLATYLGMREMKKRNGKLTVIMPYIYRYLRLTPPYAFGILLCVSFYGKMGDGPNWPGLVYQFSKPCEEYWWTNLLYINSIYPIDQSKACYAWGWYLANDTQYFLLSPFILWLLFKTPIGGMIVLGVGTLANMAIVGGLSAHYKEQPQSLGIGLLAHSISDIMGTNNANSNLTSDLFINEVTTAAPHPTPPALTEADVMFSDLYFRPWCRIGAYFIGMATGYFLYRTRLRMQMNKIFVLVMWIVVTILALTVVYGLWGATKDGRPLSVGLAAFYNLMSRPIWGACLAWLVIACSHGYGGPINIFLSWKAFIPLSRLTYCAYLIHPMIIYWFYTTMEVASHFSMTLMMFYFIGFVVLTNAFAYVLAMLIEMPTIGIIKTLLRGKPDNKVPEEEQTIKNKLSANTAEA